MPPKMTYGKRKKSILSLFPVLRDEDKSPQPLKTKAEKRVSSTVSMAAFYGKNNSDSNQQSTLALDDSKEEMTSMLINDTALNQFTGETGRCISKLGSAKVLPNPSRQNFFNDKVLPRLPRLSFDGGDYWNTSPHTAVASAVERSNEMHLLSDMEDFDSCPPPVSRQPTHARKSSAPPLPRKSSKRSRQRELKQSVEARNTTGDGGRQLAPRKLSKMAQKSSTCPQSLSNDNINADIPRKYPDASQQIEAMLAASKALKPDVDSPITESPVLSKKGGMGGNRVLFKMKNAITEHLYDKGFRKHHSLAKDEHLLDSDISQLPDYDEEPSAISAIELRINEGINFGNPKIQSLTGHGTIKRKPVAEDGRSLLSRKSIELLSLQDGRATGDRGLTSFDSRRQSDVSFDRSADVVSSLPSKSERFKKEPRQLPSKKNVEPDLEVDFDALFSSSPIAQSTPRIRLEPTFEENGDKKLRNVPADSRSLFDPDTSVREIISDPGISTPPPQSSDPTRLTTKRNNSQVKDISLGVKSHMSKRRKRHSSPGKAELEGLKYGPAHSISTQEELTLSFGELRTGERLKAKDSNAPLSQAAKRGKKGNQLGIFDQPKQAMTGSLMAEPARRPLPKVTKPSMIPKPAGVPTMRRRTEPRQYHQLMREVDESAMDTDELQWESTLYRIGMRS